MPLGLDIKQIFSSRSVRVKCTELHPSEPWLLISLYNGRVSLWNYDSHQLVWSTDIGCDQPPVRASKFIPRKNWIVIGSDDAQLRVYNYNTWEKVVEIQAHYDYIRSILIHPFQPYVITASDDGSIKLWDWSCRWECTQVFKGHSYFVMCLAINPKDNNMFASASLDRTIKVWHLGSPMASFTLEGHKKGVNSVYFHPANDKPYLVSGADDCYIKVWDYQQRSCIQTLEGHVKGINTVMYHPKLPIILSGSEDCTFRIWHSGTNRLEKTINYNLERLWTICCHDNTNMVALGFDEGSHIIKLGREEPAMSMDSSGKIIWAKHSEIQQANIKAISEQDIKDCERLPLAVKDMGSCEIYPQTVAHNPNGRFVVMCGDGEYIIYTAMALRNKTFGSAQEFVWSNDSSVYATRESTSVIKIFKNFKEQKSFKPVFGVESIYGGNMLGVRSVSGLAFYEWDSTELIRRIEITPKHVFWSETGELVCITTEDSFFILRYSTEAVEKAKENKEDITEDGIEDAFEVVGEIEEVVKTGIWVGDCFIYTNSVNRLNYYVGGEIVTIAHLDRVMYLLGYIPKDNRLYLGDKELNVVSFSLLLSVLEYQTSVMRRDFETADKVLPSIPREHRTRIAHFLEKQGFKSQALAVTFDPEHKFELALQLGDLKTAYQIAKESEAEQKWKQLAELAISKCEFGLAQECLHQAQDFGGLLLLASSAGNASMVARLGDTAEKSGQNNVAFLSQFVLGSFTDQKPEGFTPWHIIHHLSKQFLARLFEEQSTIAIPRVWELEDSLEILIKTDRLPEAAFFARTYLPSQVSRVVELWREQLGKVNKKAANSLADPQEYENLFPGLKEAFVAEEYLKPQRQQLLPANVCPKVPLNADRNPLEEMQAAIEKGTFKSGAAGQTQEEEDDDFEEATESPGTQKAETSSPQVSAEDMAEIEKELELDLDFLHIDTSDANLVEGLLED